MIAEQHNNPSDIPPDDTFAARQAELLEAWTESVRKLAEYRATGSSQTSTASQTTAMNPAPRNALDEFRRSIEELNKRLAHIDEKGREQPEIAPKPEVSEKGETLQRYLDQLAEDTREAEAIASRTEDLDEEKSAKLEKSLEDALSIELSNDDKRPAAKPFGPVPDFMRQAGHARAVPEERRVKRGKFVPAAVVAMAVATIGVIGLGSAVVFAGNISATAHTAYNYFMQRADIAPEPPVPVIEAGSVQEPRYVVKVKTESYTRKYAPNELPPGSIEHIIGQYGWLLNPRLGTNGQYIVGPPYPTYVHSITTKYAPGELPAGAADLKRQDRVVLDTRPGANGRHYIVVSKLGDYKNVAIMPPGEIPQQAAGVTPPVKQAATNAAETKTADAGQDHHKHKVKKVHGKPRKDATAKKQPERPEGQATRQRPPQLLPDGNG